MPVHGIVRKMVCIVADAGAVAVLVALSVLACGLEAKCLDGVELVAGGRGVRGAYRAQHRLQEVEQEQEHDTHGRADLEFAAAAAAALMRRHSHVAWRCAWPRRLILP